MEKTEYIEGQLAQNFRTWLGRVTALGGVVFLGLGLLDHIAAPDRFAQFLPYRAVTAGTLFLIALVARSPRDLIRPKLLAYLAVGFSAAAIEATILQSGGHRSAYAPGMMLLGVCVIGFIPAPILFHLGIAVLIFLTYLVPILLVEPVTDFRFFFTMNYFLVTLFGAGIFLRSIYQRILVDDLGLRFELAREKAGSERRFAALINHHPGLAVARDAAGRYCYANEQFVRLFGDPVGRRVGEVMPERAVAAAAADRTIIAEGKSVESAFTTTRDGEARDWLDLGFPITDEKGRPVLAAHITVDVTERRRMEDRISRSEREWEEAFNAITDAITIHDREFHIIRANPAAEKLLGLPCLQMTKTQCYASYHGTDRPPEDCASCSSLRSGEPTATERFEPHLNRFIEIRAIPRKNAAGELVGLVHVVRDISQRKEAERKIRQHLQQLEALRTIDRAISASLDLNVDLEVILDQVVTQLGVDAADVLLVNRHTMALEFAAGRGFLSTAVKNFRLRVGEGGPGHAAQERRLVAVADCAAAPPGFCARATALAGEGFAAAFFVPLLAKGQVQGVLEVFLRRRFQPEPEWINFLETLAGQAAIAVDNTRLFQDLQRANMELRMAYDTTIEGWSRALDFRDKETEGHSERVTELTVRVARFLGIGEEDLVHVRRGALLHDIGKLGVPDGILLKSGPLTEEEWTVMRRHPAIAHALLAPIPHLKPAIAIPYAHHERWDGTGYPCGLKGEEIPLAVRIFSLVDFWDALTSERPYRPAWSEDEVRAEVLRLAGTHFDPKVVAAFLEMCGR